ncbi:SMP-30/gluconolactonase/LRE family protein [Maritimibacter sp. DP1N21-5]|uniref:SMP-30/gluconolactonase/LRE family protein n=1 Tax=Maritimibacter sp. DP1N21-5 TaxID=2836867 RepID=UPI001C486BD9|nr:SMP-30/gluconolactonase/LRE family protein [Maritimibacter sp. DP1N21-5]MBV7407831.1 SMP-30/gluconolactonase/LRE family protein [Maritimibacter sp. DP1N21-5]
MIFDDRACILGEGALWHPERGELFWFDIKGQRLLSRHFGTGVTRDIDLPEVFSAAGWIDRETLVLASETGLWCWTVDGQMESFAELESDRPGNRTNDGRIDPWGGFWIGTMGKAHERAAGAIYRHYEGETRLLFPDISVPNSISFLPDRSAAYFSDTGQRKTWRVALDSDGWPESDPVLFLDGKEHDLLADGAVVLADGTLAVTNWGRGEVLLVDPDARITGRLSVPAPFANCPAPGGPDFTTLYVTSATDGHGFKSTQDETHSGKTFGIENAPRGLPEYRFRLS